MKLRINPALVVVLAGLALWQAAGIWSDLVRNVTGTPLTVGRELAVVLSSSDILFHVGVTAFELGLGLVLAVALGLFLSLGLGTWDYTHRIIEPFLIVANTVPKVITLPAFLMLLGTGYSSKIAFGALHGMLPIAIIVSNGLRKVLANSQMQAAMTMNATRGQLIGYILFPSVLPYLVTALRLAVSLTLLGVILGEMYVARAGLGFMLMRWYGELQIPKMLSVVVLIGSLAFTLDFLFRRLEAAVWRIHGIRTHHA
jgi:NitT/TauT family transport system permease protein